MSATKIALQYCTIRQQRTSSLRIYQDSLGDWYASFVVRVTDQPLLETDGAVGIDWGVSVIATASDSEYDFESPQFAKASAEQLAKYQRRMARRKPKPGQLSSNGYKTAKKQTAKLHKKSCSPTAACCSAMGPKSCCR